MYDLASLREQFPVLSSCIYLDSASTSPTPRCAVEAMEAYFFKFGANYGRGAYNLARQTTETFEKTREQLGDFLGVPAEQVVFTRNTTESINLVARGICWKEGDEVITTSLEHHANLLPWLALRDRGVQVKVLPHRDGIVREADVQEAVGPATRLVAVTHMTNVLGTVQPVGEFARIAHDAGAAILVDAAQTAGHLPLPPAGSFDYLALPGHKGLLGPQGTGALYIADPDTVGVSCYGGGIVGDVTLDRFTLLPCPARFEPGTPNIPGIIGLGAAISLVESLGVEEIHRHETSVGRQISSGLSAIPGVTVYSPPGSTVISFNIEGIGPEVVALFLDHKAAVCVRSGMHCAQPLSQSLHPQGTVRASVGCYTTKEEVNTFIRTIEEIVLEKRES
jgi:cysteine desulfurase/selenocysteine lyase